MKEYETGNTENTIDLIKYLQKEDKERQEKNSNILRWNQLSILEYSKVFYQSFVKRN
ncbi:hypothetical protein GM3709_166 [Geminocystis sp. NIES-3709]|nr:hypothetical protein GM3709_166 [Geminocystis sp. NIES-3709]